MITQSEIRNWLHHSDVCDTHMLVICDTFSHEDYPVYTADVQASIKRYNNASMQRVMEVYDLRQDFETQLAEKRTWNI